MQTDPIGYADGMNWYAYVGNDPVNLNDPSGLACGETNQAPCPPTEVVIHYCSGGSWDGSRCVSFEETNGTHTLYGYVQYKTAEDSRNQDIFRQNLRQNVDPMMERGLLIYTGTIVGIGVVIGTCLEGGCAVIGRLLFRAKAPVGNAMPFKQLFAKYGGTGRLQGLFKWGQGGQQSLEALSRVGPKFVQELKAGGVTRQMVLDIRASYSAQLSEGAGVGTAGIRVRMMTEILKYW